MKKMAALLLAAALLAAALLACLLPVSAMAEAATSLDLAKTVFVNTSDPDAYSQYHYAD